MNEIDTIIERLRANEDTTRKFFEIESKILGVLNFKDFFELLLTEIQDIFQIPYVWISLIKRSEISGLLETFETSDILKERINIIDEYQFKEFVGSGARPRLVNEKLKPYFQLFPAKRKFFIKSLAVIPLSLDGELIGSLNQGDSIATRFQPGIDTSLLEKLALKVSLCLSNVTAHEKLRLLASQDSDTGLLTPAGFRRVLKREMSRSRHYGRTFSVAGLISSLHQTSQSLKSAEMENSVLRYTLRMINAVCRGCDVATRIRGNGFLLLLPETDEQTVTRFLGELEAFLRAQPLKLPGIEEPLSFEFRTITSGGDRSLPGDEIDAWVSALDSGLRN